MAEYVFKIDEEIKACYSDVYSQDGYCPFHFYAFNGGSHCSISDCKCTKTKRPEGCPLVELPPHGRLGDLDSIDGKIKGKIDDVPKSKDGTRTVKQAFYVNGLLRAKDLIRNSMTVIPASEETD